MLRKITLSVCALVVLALFAFRPMGECVTHDDGLMNKSNITCSSCHGSSIGVDIVVTGGKLEYINDRLTARLDQQAISEEVDGNYTVQLYLSDESGQGENIRIESGQEVVVSDGVLLPGLQRGETLQLSYDGLPTAPVEISVEYVIADGDGSPSGDRVVKQNITLEPDFATFFQVTTEQNDLAMSYLSYGQEDISIEIFDLLGKRVHSEHLQSQHGVNSYRTNISHLDPNRVYFAAVTRGGERLTKKFMPVK